jgi:hypothetical protein
MVCSSYKTIAEVLTEFQVIYAEANFISQTAFTVSDYFRKDLELMMRYGVVDNSEFAICENLIYPILKEVWKTYHNYFTLWNHQSLNLDEKLSRFPQYILAKLSPLGKVVFDQPYLIIVEAKQDNFRAGWAQCLEEMITAQKLNQEYPIVIFGIVSNGLTWQFSKLENQKFTRNITPYSIYELDRLFAVVNFVFQQSELQLNHLVPPY